MLLSYTQAQREEIRAKFYEKVCYKYAKINLTSENIEALYMQCLEVMRAVALAEPELRATMLADLKRKREAAYSRMEAQRRDAIFADALNTIEKF